MRQLADEYLKRRQDELGERIDPDEYPRELQKVKAYLALHQVYGVDLNATAVELAEISLWLDTMVDGPAGAVVRPAPAPRQLADRRPPRGVHAAARSTTSPGSSAVPRDVPLTALVEDIATRRPLGDDGRIHHFLLPAEGWGAAADAKEAKDLAPGRGDGAQDVAHGRSRPSRPRSRSTRWSSWRTGSRRCGSSRCGGCRSPSSEIRRDIDALGSRRSATHGGGGDPRADRGSRSPTPNGAYRRLRRVMDAWCALWFWPLTEDRRSQPPTLTSGSTRCQRSSAASPKAAQGRSSGADASAGDRPGTTSATPRTLDLDFAGAEPSTRCCDEHPWLEVCERSPTSRASSTGTRLRTGLRARRLRPPGR